MAYKLIITERAKELLDERAYYLVYGLRNKQAAGHLFDEVDKIHDRLEKNPYQFPFCRDEYLKRMEYREAVLMEMNYLIIFKIEDDVVYVLGIFHQLENFCNKM